MGSGLVVRADSAYLTFVLLTEGSHVEGSKIHDHRIHQGPGRIAQGDPGTAALAGGDGAGRRGYARRRVAEGEGRLRTHTAGRRVWFASLCGTGKVDCGDGRRGRRRGEASDRKSTRLNSSQ